MNPHNSWNELFDKPAAESDFLPTLDEEFYPPREQVFAAFTMPVDAIKVVLLGQDPYHGPGQAHGLSFSVPVGIPIPPSLRNIFKELQGEFPERNYDFKHGCLTGWHDRGIFLLNAALTVAPGKPNSHADRWSHFTDEVIKYIVKHNSTCIFLLLGAFAKKKATLIDDPMRYVLGVHPSPLSAHRGFFGSNIFQHVEEKLGEEIDWHNRP